MATSDLTTIYDLCALIERKKEFLFVVFPSEDPNVVGIDVRDYENEDALDGGWFTVEEAEEFLMNYLEETK